MDDRAAAADHFRSHTAEGKDAWSSVAAGKAALRSQYEAAKEMGGLVAEARETVVRLTAMAKTKEAEAGGSGLGGDGNSHGEL